MHSHAFPDCAEIWYAGVLWEPEVAELLKYTFVINRNILEVIYIRYTNKRDWTIWTFKHEEENDTNAKWDKGTERQG